MSQKRLGISAAILAYSLWGVLGVFGPSYTLCPQWIH